MPSSGLYIFFYTLNEEKLERAWAYATSIVVAYRKEKVPHLVILGLEH